MIKKEFMAAVAAGAKDKLGARVPVAVVEAVLDSANGVAAKQLATDGRFRFPGLVNLSARVHGPRTARNPKTGEECLIAAGITVKAKPVAAFAEEVRNIEGES